MNEAITDNNPSPQTSSAFNMRVINDEDSEQQLFIAETGSINGSNSLLLTSDILTKPAVKICSQVPHEDDDEDDDNEQPNDDKLALSSTRYHNLQLSASKSNTSGARNKRKNFQPRSIFMIDENEEDNHFETNSNDGENEDQSDNENDELINGKSGSSSCTSSVCDSSEVQLQVSSQQKSIVTSITGIRRCASLQRTSQPSLQQSQPLDLSHQDNNGKTNGLTISSDNKMHHKSGDNRDKQKRALHQTDSPSVTNPMDLSRKRSSSEDEVDDDEDESGDEEEVIDLRFRDYAESTMNELLGLYGLNRQPKASFSNAAEATVTTGMKIIKCIILHKFAYCVREGL